MTKPPSKPLYRECLCGCNLDNHKAKHPWWCPNDPDKKKKDKKSKR